MSGNTTQAGLLLGQRQTAAALPYVVAILCFTGGSFAGTWITQPVSRRSRQLLFTTVSVFLGITTAIMQAGAPDSRLMILMLSSSMGMLNSALACVGSEGVKFTFGTGGLSRLGSHLAMALRPPPEAPADSSSQLGRALVQATVWAAFLGGAVVSGAVLNYVGTWMLLPPLLVLLILIALLTCA